MYYIRYKNIIMLVFWMVRGAGMDTNNKNCN